MFPLTTKGPGLDEGDDFRRNIESYVKPLIEGRHLRAKIQ